LVACRLAGFRVNDRQSNLLQMLVAGGGIMSDDRTSKLQCPRCGQRLVRDEIGDMLNCPVHGPIGRFHDLAMKEIGDVLREVREALDKSYNADDDQVT
jgi:predicted RNA-binding Zn-ribbon protein involved in translation (DUF1610 family)